MSKIKYIKVPVSERLPKKKEAIFTNEGQLIFLPFAGWYNGCMKAGDPVYWLEEVPDREQEMKEMLEKIVNIQYHSKLPLSSLNSAVREAKELLNSIKQ